MTIIESPKTRCPRCKVREYQDEFCNHCHYFPGEWAWLKWWLAGVLLLTLIVWNWK